MQREEKLLESFDKERKLIAEKANAKFQAELNEKIRVTVIATGFRARLPHTLTSLKREQTPVNNQQQQPQPQKDQREVQQQQPQPMVRPKVVNMPDPHEYIEPTRSIKSQN